MRPISGLVSVWFGIIMVVVVLFLGALIAFTDLLIDRLYGNKRSFFIVLMFSYAIYRSYRIYAAVKQQQKEDSTK